MSITNTGTPARPLSNDVLNDAAFERERAAVLAQWPDVGRIDLDEAVAFHHEHMAGRNVADALMAAKRDGRTLVQPRAGVANLEGETALLRTLEEAGADILPITVDSMTRNLRYDVAQDAAADSTPTKSLLNGYPVVTHGVAATRDLLLRHERPVMLRANATDLRLVAEVAFGSGMSGFVSGPLYSTVEYSKDVRLQDSIANWQYVFRLIGKYAEAGVPIADDSIGFSQAGSFSVPGLMHAGVVLDALMMAGQGVKHILAYQMSQATLAQDIAACLAVRELTEHYLAVLGFDDVEVYVASNHWNGPFPEDEAAAYGLISVNTVATVLTRSEMVYVKSVEEAVGLPTGAGNAASVRATRYVIHALQGQVPGAIDDEEVETERRVDVAIATSLVDATLELGGGDPTIGSVRAFEAGVLDVPFAPTRIARGDALVTRDAHGAVRFLDYGALPIPRWVRDYERERLAERAVRQSKPALDYDDIVADLHHLAWQ